MIVTCHRCPRQIAFKGDWRVRADRAAAFGWVGRGALLCASCADMTSLRPMTDHQLCRAVRDGAPVTDIFALVRAGERGLVEFDAALTPKGGQLLDGIEPTACSGWHMGGADRAGDWREARKR